MSTTRPGDDPTPRAGEGGGYRKTPTQLATDPAFTSTYASVVGLAGAGIDTTGATDSAAALNALLATAGGKVARGVPGASYLIAAPLVVPSGATLDMSGCTVTLKASSNCNMLQNAAVAPATRVLDAAMTSGSAALTSATVAALGTSAVNALVGQAVTVQGAGANGVPLFTTVSAVTGSLGTYGLTLAATAGTTVAGQFAAIGTRDTNITVIGGTWDRGGNNGAGGSDVTAHNMRFRHVDGLDVRDTAHKSTSGKYGINPGDCTRVRVRGATFAGYSSDGVHFNGPCSQIVVRDVMGTAMHDDLVSFTARDSTTIITDCAGDITDVLVDGASFQTASVGGFASALKVVAGKTTDASANYGVRRLTARNITAPNTTAPLIYVGDTTAGIFDDLLFEDVRSLGGATSGIALLHGGTLDRITCRRFSPAAGDSYAVGVDATVTRLAVEGGSFQPSGSSSYFLTVSNGGTITSLIVTGVQIKAAATNGALIRANSGATITRAQVANVHIDSTGFAGTATVNCTSGSTVSTVQIDNLVAVNVPYPLGIYNGTTAISANGVTGTGMSGWLLTQGSTAAITVLGASGLSGTNDVLGINASTTVRLKSFGIPVDIGTTGIAKNVGDMAMNTNAARSCGVGPVTCNGTAWVNIITEATF